MFKIHARGKFAVIRTVGRSLRLLSPHEKKRLALFSVARLLANGLDLLGLGAIGAFIAIAAAAPTEIGFLQSVDLSRPSIVLLLIALAGIFFSSKTLVAVALAKKSLAFLATIETRFSAEIAQSVFTSSLSKFKEMSLPETEWAILRSTQIAFTSILGQAISLVSNIALALAVFAILVVTDWLSAASVLIFILALLGVFQRYSQNLIDIAGSDLGQGSIDVHRAISNLSAAYREISVLGKTKFFLSELFDSRARVAQSGASMEYISTLPRLLTELGIILGALGFVAFQFLVLGGDFDLVVFGIFLIGSLRILSAVLPIHATVLSYRYNSHAAKTAQDLLWNLVQEKPNEDLDVEQSATAPSGKAGPFPEEGIAIEVREVVFSYEEGANPNPTLRNVSLAVKAGSTVALIGPSGAGKSTLVDLILGFNAPSQGAIQLDGEPPLSFRERRPGAVGYVPQKPGMISGTIRENIALAVPAAEVDHSRLEHCLSAAGLSALMNSLPDGLDTDLGKHTDALSGGQMQRLGLARALYPRPNLLILDEATSALDAETESIISDSLDRIRGGTTIIVIAHRLSTIQHADCIYVMDNGQIEASGTFRELRRSNPLVQRYVELMSFDE